MEFTLASKDKAHLTVFGQALKSGYPIIERLTKTPRGAVCVRAARGPSVGPRQLIGRPGEGASLPFFTPSVKSRTMKSETRVAVR